MSYKLIYIIIQLPDSSKNVRIQMTNREKNLAENLVWSHFKSSFGFKTSVLK
jgi:hypothetical protein